MIRIALTAAILGVSGLPAVEQNVDPYPQADANAGATPFTGPTMWRAFHGPAGIARIVDKTIDLSIADPRISDIFKNHDLIRLRRTLKEQFCYILNGGCHYTGRTMQAAHKDMGIQTADLAILVEHLRTAMCHDNVAFWAQNRFLAKLAPMKRTVIKH